MHYNFAPPSVLKERYPRTSPMAAGVADRIWFQIAALLD
jgi:hypothetical protein